MANENDFGDDYVVITDEDGQEYIGPNLMGRLLMELRDNGSLTYNLPDEAIDFSDLK